MPYQLPFRSDGWFGGPLIALLLAAGPAQAGQSWHVAPCGDDTWTGMSSECTDPDGPLARIQSALDRAIDGDEIIVGPGKYNEVIDFKGKAVRLRSAEGPEQTVIDGTGLDMSVVRCVSGEGYQTVFDGFTITGGSGTPVYDEGDFLYDRFGGGMYNDSSSPTISHCIFEFNTAFGEEPYGIGQGGGMYNRSAAPSITFCTFIDNAALGNGQGGAIYNEDCVTHVSQSSFISNYVGGEILTYGASIYSVKSILTVTSCTFEENVSRIIGGAIVNYQCPDILIQASTFSRNEAQALGGAISNELSSGIIEACVFEDNVANDEGAQGGAVCNWEGCNFVFRNCTFTGNYCSGRGAQRGGAMMNQDCDRIEIAGCEFNDNFVEMRGGAIYNAAGDLIISNSSCVGNLSQFRGGVIFNSCGSVRAVVSTLAYNDAAYGGAFDSDCGEVIIDNCILWSNSGDEIYGSASVRYSNVTGGFEGEGNIDADPLFIRNPDPAQGDWGELRLRADSPCIDAGDPKYVFAPGETDLDCLFRVWDGDSDGLPVVDMGAHEFGSRRYADINCDGAVDFNDIDAFVTVLISRSDYKSLYPDCHFMLADTNEDGFVDFNDIDSFVECLVNGGCE